MKRYWYLSVAAIAALGNAPLAAETSEELAARFGARQSILDISLSPSGKKIAYIAPDGSDDDMLYVVDSAGGVTRPILSASEKNSQLVHCDWVTDDRLVCEFGFLNNETFGSIVGFSRMISVNADGSNVLVLTASSSKAVGVALNGGDVVALDSGEDPTRILMTRVWIPEFSTGTRISRDLRGYGVEEVDVVSGKRWMREQPDVTVIQYIADENGRVRLKATQPRETSGYIKPVREYRYRPSSSNNWQELSRIEMDSQTYTGFLPVAVDTKLDVAYGFETVGGYKVLSKAALDGSGKRDIVVQRNDADVDHLIRIGRQRRVVGVSYATEKRQVSYIDEALAKLAARFGKALPGKPLINIIDASADEQKLLLIASSDTDPGMVYLYDKGTNELSEVLPLREELKGRTMGEMTPTAFPAADGTMIPGYLTLPPGSKGKNLPSIVLPHGGPSARDEWGFDWLVQFFVAKGYAVLQPNYRGSSGYGDAWFGQNGVKAWRTAVGDVNDAGHWLVKQGIADPEKLAIVGWSYGGYAALQSQVLEPKLYKAVAAIAPVTDFASMKSDSKNFSNYKLVKDFIGSGPHIEEGSPARNAGSFEAPVILFHGTMDYNVDIEQSRLMRNRLKDAGKQVEYVEFEDQTHSIASADERKQLLTKLDLFLTAALGGQ